MKLILRAPERVMKKFLTFSHRDAEPGLETEMNFKRYSNWSYERFSFIKGIAPETLLSIS